jgi:hypothetical protein
MDSPDEIGAARNAFDSLRRKGHCAFTCASTGAKRRVREFSPGLTALLIVPGIIGAENDATGNCLGVDVAGCIAAINALGSRLRAWSHGLPRRALEAAPAMPPERVRHEEAHGTAKREALAVLLRLLSREQRRTLRQQHCFYVRGGCSGSLYRIRNAENANIDLLGARGVVQYRLCILPEGDIPLYSIMATQLLHLQDPGAEHEFLREADVYPGAG